MPDGGNPSKRVYMCVARKQRGCPAYNQYESGSHERNSMAQDVEKPSDPGGLTLEAWSEGFMVGALIVMICVTIANMRRGVLLHKLILTEVRMSNRSKSFSISRFANRMKLFFGAFHGTFIFPNPPVYHWYLSATVILLNTSYSLHNVIAWIKNKPFLSKRASLFYIITVALAQPYWVLAIVANVRTARKYHICS